MPSHNLDYEILGASAQTVEIILDPGETVIAEAGVMNYMTEGIRFEARMGDGSEGGVLGKLWGMGKRLMTGESLFMTHFSNAGAGRARVGFAAPYPGSVVPVMLSEVGGYRPKKACLSRGPCCICTAMAATWPITLALLRGCQLRAIKC